MERNDRNVRIISNEIAFSLSMQLIFYLFFFRIWHSRIECLRWNHSEGSQSECERILFMVDNASLLLQVHPQRRLDFKPRMLIKTFSFFLFRVLSEEIRTKWEENIFYSFHRLVKRHGKTYRICDIVIFNLYETELMHVYRFNLQLYFVFYALFSAVWIERSPSAYISWCVFVCKRVHEHAPNEWTVSLKLI